jgi:hypothetical protein
VKQRSVYYAGSLLPGDDPCKGIPVCGRVDYFFKGLQFFLPAENFISQQPAVDRPVPAQDVVAKAFQEALFFSFNGLVSQLVNVKNWNTALFKKESHMVFSSAVASGKAYHFFFIHCRFPIDAID